MSNRTHAMCIYCRNEREPAMARDPAKYQSGEDDVCCFCGKPTDAGIYYRADPATVACLGESGAHLRDEED